LNCREFSSPGWARIVQEGLGQVTRYRWNWRHPEAWRTALTSTADVTVVDAGNGLAEADGCLVSEAGREAEHSPLSARLGSSPASSALIAASPQGEQDQLQGQLDRRGTPGIAASIRAAASCH